MPIYGKQSEALRKEERQLVADNNRTLEITIKRIKIINLNRPIKVNKGTAREEQAELYFGAETWISNDWSEVKKPDLRMMDNWVLNVKTGNSNHSPPLSERIFHLQITACSQYY